VKNRQDDESEAMFSNGATRSTPRRQRDAHGQKNTGAKRNRRQKQRGRKNELRRINNRPDHAEKQRDQCTPHTRSTIPEGEGRHTRFRGRPMLGTFAHFFGASALASGFGSPFVIAARLCSDTSLMVAF